MADTYLAMEWRWIAEELESLAMRLEANLKDIRQRAEIARRESARYDGQVAG